MEKAFEELQLKDDFMFSVVMRNPKFCKPFLERVLDFIDGKEASDDYTRELEKEIESVRGNEKWRLDYMTLQMKYQEKYEQGIEQGKIQSAINMLKKNQLSIEDIASYTGLTIEQVEALKGDLQSI